MCSREHPERRRFSIRLLDRCTKPSRRRSASPACGSLRDQRAGPCKSSGAEGQPSRAPGPGERLGPVRHPGHPAGPAAISPHIRGCASISPSTRACPRRGAPDGARRRRPRTVRPVLRLRGSRRRAARAGAGAVQSRHCRPVPTSYLLRLTTDLDAASGGEDIMKSLTAHPGGGIVHRACERRGARGRPPPPPGACHRAGRTIRRRHADGHHCRAQRAMFVNFPQWGGDNAPFTVGEVVNGTTVPYPDLARRNKPDPAAPAAHFISVQSVVAAGARERLWVLDTAAPGFRRTPQPGGAKLVAIDLATNTIVRTIVLPDSVVLADDLSQRRPLRPAPGRGRRRLHHRQFQRGHRRDHRVDLATGKAFRRLSGHASTAPSPTSPPSSMASR